MPITSPPIFIGDVNRPLTCAEHDENLRRLLSRNNHTCTQAASTIHDLKETVLSWDELDTLFNLRDSVLNSISELQLEIFDDSGHLSTYVTNIRNQLSNEISDLGQQLNNATQNISNNTSSISSLEDRIDANDLDNQQIWQAIGGSSLEGRLLPEPIWRDQGASSTILMLYLDTVRDLLYWHFPRTIRGGNVADIGFVREEYINLGRI